MIDPSAGPATVGAVKAHLGITDSADDVYLGAICHAVNARVSGWPCGQIAAAVDSWEDPIAAAVVLGSVMLAATLYRRRNSPDGIAAFGEMGAVYVQRSDPQAAMLLGLGAWQTPAVG